MLKIAVLTLFPEMFDAITQYGVTSRAIQHRLIKLVMVNPRDHSHDKHRRVDDRPFGGGPGMVMKIEPLTEALKAARDLVGQSAKLVYLSPQGSKLDHIQVKRFARETEKRSLILLAGRYEGVDQRFIDQYVDEECSIGDYVLSGGELPAMVFLDALIRWIPGVLGNQSSADQDSFADGLLDYPSYTRPKRYNGLEVPSVLLSGDHKKISQWRQKESKQRTLTRRPDLLNKKSE